MSIKNTDSSSTAALLKDIKENNAYYIRIIDIEEGNALWEQELYACFEFNQDTPYFYTFDTDNYLAGLKFSDQEEGQVFHDKLYRREHKASKTPSRFLRSRICRKPKVTNDIISVLEDVTHVGHEREMRFSVKEEKLIKELRVLGISESEIEQNQDFIQEYFQQHE
ncbi:hypothetical protein BC941DRAFT_476308 [Chlamydoabsidia padenii]|nr:hypothetical protein BC941DRAFT_476308 [Chlamydoabsidia padenii]